MEYYLELACLYNSGTWVGATTASALPSASVNANVWIRAGHTINVSSSPVYCLNMTIESGAKLWANVANTTGRYVRMYGTTFTNNGIFGGTNDGLGFNLYNTGITLTGTGSYGIDRIQQSIAGCTLTFDADALVTYAGSAGAGGSSIYNNSLDNLTVIVNAGKTLTTAALSYITIGTSGSSTPTAGLNITLTINGTVTTGTNGHINFLNNTGADTNTRTSTINIGSTGVLNCNGNLLMPATGTGVLNIASGGVVNTAATKTTTLGASTTTTNNGTMNVGGIVDFSNSVSFIGGGGAFNLATGAVINIAAPTGLEPVAGPIRTTTRNFESAANYSYVGSIAQVTGSDLPASVNNLTVNNALGLSLGANATVNGILTMTAGTLSLGANNLTIASTGSIAGASATNYIVTDGAGKLTQSVLAATPVLFPVGATTTSYNPVTLTPTDATDIAMNVGTTLPALVPSNYNYISKVWDISSTAPSSTVVTLTPSDVLATSVTDVIGHYVAGDYVNVAAIKTGNAYSATFSTFSPFVTGTSDIGTSVSQNKISGITFDGKTIHNTNQIAVQVFDIAGRKLISSNRDIVMSNQAKGIYIVKSVKGAFKITL